MRQGILLADEPQDFAQTAIHLAEDKVFALAQSRLAREIVENRYSLEATYGKFFKALQDLGEMNKKNLLIVSHVQHYIWEGQIWAFGGYAREIDIWADLFPTIKIASPCVEMAPPGDCLPFTRENISVIPTHIPEVNGKLLSKLSILLSLPRLVWQLGRLMRKAGAVHVRLPGSLGAVGAVIAPLFSKRVIAKYAGTWPDFVGEPRTYRLQKRILKSRWFSGPVTVYGEWPEQPPHVIPFFTSVLTKQQIALAREVSAAKELHSPTRVLFVGRLDKGKNAHLLLDALRILKDQGVAFEARVIGDGHQREQLHHQARALKLENQVVFAGAIPFSEVIESYHWGDILVLVSENAEGWPKAIAEAMAFGLVCFGSQRGLIPQMLAEGRGIVVSPITAQNLANNLRDLIDTPQLYKSISQKSAAWSQGYSLEGLREAIRKLLIEKWELPEDTLVLKHSEGNDQ